MSQQNNVKLIEYKYNMGVYNLHDVFDLVTRGALTKDAFHWITFYSYDGVKQSKGW